MADRPHPREILAVLEQRARRRFGQHFLWRGDVVRAMVRASKLAPGEQVAEIGPGLGILTDALVDAGARVTAVELDRDLAAYVEAQFPTVRVVQADAARVDWAKLFPEGGVRLVSNLPYNVGTGLLMDALRRPEVFRSATVMLQREVVDRLLAEPGSKTYGALTVQARMRAKGRFAILVPPSAFHPPPKVESGIAHFEILAEPDAGSAGVRFFDTVVRASFSQRRKTIRNCLTPLFGRDVAEAALAAAGVDAGLRAEVLGIDAFRRLAEELAARGGGSAPVAADAPTDADLDPGAEGDY